MPDRKLRVGTRRSPLALRQVEEVISALKAIPDLKVEIVGIDTYGDRDKVTPISDMEGTDFFTREIDQALLKGEIDFAVHSAKDLPDVIPNGIKIVAITRSIDPYDALVSRNSLKIDKLPPGARIGASSSRRKEQLRKYRSDFNIIDIRGTIEERLRLLRRPRNDGELDAIIVAACALVRLGLQHRIAQRIPFEILKPHTLQGCLAVEAREDNKELMDLLKALDFPSP